MKEKLRLPPLEGLKKFLKQYKLIAGLILIGAVFLLLPQDKNETEAAAFTGLDGSEEVFSLKETEEKLSDILSRIEGAGEVAVMLTVHSGTERILATDRKLSEQEFEREIQEETVVISSDGGDEVVLVGQNYPVFQGALVVCQGGDDPAVQLQLTKAVSALTGLSANKITVCKGSG